MSLVLISLCENSVLLKSRSEISVPLNFHTQKSVAKLRHVPWCLPLATPLLCNMLRGEVSVGCHRTLSWQHYITRFVTLKPSLNTR